MEHSENLAAMGSALNPAEKDHTKSLLFANCDVPISKVVGPCSQHPSPPVSKKHVAWNDA